MRMKRMLLLTLAMVCLFSCARAESSAEWIRRLEEDLEAARERLGYVSSDELYDPFYLTFVGFTGYIAMDSGARDGDRYTVNTGMDHDALEAYAEYLQGFGYLREDAWEDDVQVCTFSLDEPEREDSAIPPVMTVYYWEAREMLAVRYPIVYEERGRARRAEIGIPAGQQAPRLPVSLTLENGLEITVEQVIRTNSFTVLTEEPLSLYARFRAQDYQWQSDERCVMLAQDRSGFLLLCLRAEGGIGNLRDGLQLCMTASGEDEYVIAYMPLFAAAGKMEDENVLCGAHIAETQAEDVFWIALEDPYMHKEDLPYRLFMHMGGSTDLLAWPYVDFAIGEE